MKNMNIKSSMAAFLIAIVMALFAAISTTSEASTPKLGSTDWRQALIDKAPVASPDDIPKGSSLWSAHEDGKLTYGGSKTQKLFSLKNPITGKLDGFDATMALLLAKYLTGKPKVNEVIVTSETREALLSNNTVQVVFYTYSITPEREKKVDFAGPYFISGQAIEVRDDTKDIKGLKDLANRKVCVTKGGTAYLTMTKRVPTAQLITRESSTECEAALRNGRVDAEVQDRAVLLGQVAKGGLKLVGHTLTYEPYGIGLPNNSPKAVKFLNSWIQSLIDKGVWQKVYNHTIGHVKGSKAIIPTPGKNRQPKLHLD
jgi:glutamate transport system substrate-binding protein